MGGSLRSSVSTLRHFVHNGHYRPSWYTETMRRTELIALIFLAIVLVGAIVLGVYAIIVNAANLLTFFITVWYALTF